MSSAKAPSQKMTVAAAEQLLEHLEVNLALAERLGKQGLQVADVLDDRIGRVRLWVVSGELFHTISSGMSADTARWFSHRHVSAARFCNHAPACR